jgi:hypothetical protein
MNSTGQGCAGMLWVSFSRDLQGRRVRRRDHGGDHGCGDTQRDPRERHTVAPLVVVRLPCIAARARGGLGRCGGAGHRHGRLVTGSVAVELGIPFSVQLENAHVISEAQARPAP